MLEPDRHHWVVYGAASAAPTHSSIDGPDHEGLGPEIMPPGWAGMAVQRGRDVDRAALIVPAERRDQESTLGILLGRGAKRLSAYRQRADHEGLRILAARA